MSEDNVVETLADSVGYALQFMELSVAKMHPKLNLELLVYLTKNTGESLKAIRRLV